MLELYFLRHAESAANTAPHICSGQSNHVPLTSRGILQAKALDTRFVSEGIFFDEIWRSPSVRTESTTQYGLASQPAYLQHGVDADLLEIHQGDFTGQDKKLVYTSKVLAQIAADPWNFCPPNGESQRMLADRMWKKTNEVVSRYQELGSKPRKVAFVTHGMSIKTWMRKCMQFDPHLTWLIEIENASITQFNYKQVHSNYVWVQKRVNDHGHIHNL